jgi:uncharacterized damage-inducible protein DinB
MSNPTRRADMFLDDQHDPRSRFSSTSDERTTLTSHLRWHRETLELKCSGLGAADLARRPISPSTLSLLGLVRHLADVERGWFQRVLAGLDAPRHFSSADDPDGAFTGALPDDAVVAEAWRVWRSEVAAADRFVADAPDLDVTGDDPHEGPVALREVLVHMVEEYARHNGHADLLRECIDGRVGE